MAAAVESLQNHMQQELGNFQEIQKSIQKAINNRQKLDAQLNENKIVLEELNHIEEGSIYKLIGPVLVKQDPVEAKDTVTKRIAYISKEIERIDLTVKDLESKFQKHKQTLGGLQQQFQKLTTHSKQTPTS
ncbi:prefoldin subunit 6-like [Xenia sp. Carnegie-2017]|uniref:prefoldin subunit 6-like n=1 Tax=Xenia sp. Carnegie-2017 TaxID=2897299 RepID=UPI001F04366F|nr:prefoldin subunit 6-like [Xenia sp. Carnegie-2017]